jgi:hypothetical protein
MVGGGGGDGDGGDDDATNEAAGAAGVDEEDEGEDGPAADDVERPAEFTSVVMPLQRCDSARQWPRRQRPRRGPAPAQGAKNQRERGTHRIAVGNGLCRRSGTESDSGGRRTGAAIAMGAGAAATATVVMAPVLPAAAAGAVVIFFVWGGLCTFSLKTRGCRPVRRNLAYQMRAAAVTA